MDKMNRKPLGKFKPVDSRWNNENSFRKTKYSKFTQKSEFAEKNNRFSSEGSRTSNSFFIRSKDFRQKQETDPSTSNTMKKPFNKKKQHLQRDIKTTKGFFTKNKPNLDQTQETSRSSTSKKPFDKKKWRLQKYSNKYKVQQWEEKRKMSVLKEYYREIKDEDPKIVDVQKIYAEDDEDQDSAEKVDEVENENNLNSEIINEKTDSTVNNRKRKKPYLSAQQEYQRLKEEKIQRKQEFQKRKEERDNALKEYKEKKAQKYKKLNQKTKKGQPIMKYRMEMLLEQIQKSMNAE